mgnify:CR=1 FL=1
MCFNLLRLALPSSNDQQRLQHMMMPPTQWSALLADKLTVLGSSDIVTATLLHTPTCTLAYHAVPRNVSGLLLVRLCRSCPACCCNHANPSTAPPAQLLNTASASQCCYSQLQAEEQQPHPPSAGGPGVARLSPAGCEGPSGTPGDRGHLCAAPRCCNMSA